MKIRNIPVITLLCFILCSRGFGTPDHQVTVSEKFMGSNLNGYVILRTEIDNLGSYYNSRIKTYLVEYSKKPIDLKYEASLGAEISTQLILDVSVSEMAPVSREVNIKNREVNLANLLDRFPNEIKTWESEVLAKITCEPTSGLHLGRHGLAWGGWIKKRFVGDQNAKLNWSLDSVLEDDNCLYFSVSSENYGQRLVSITPEKTKRVKDQLSKQPFYLIAATFKDKKEAFKKAQEIAENTDGKFIPEVWSVGRMEEEIVYVVADSQTNDNIRGSKFESLEALTKVDFSVMSSAYFNDRFLLNETKE